MIVFSCLQLLSIAARAVWLGWPTGHLVFRWKEEVGRKGCLEEEEEECEVIVAVFQSCACVWRFVRWSAPQTLCSRLNIPPLVRVTVFSVQTTMCPRIVIIITLMMHLWNFSASSNPVGFHQFTFIQMKPHSGLTVYKDRQKKTTNGWRRGSFSKLDSSALLFCPPNWEESIKTKCSTCLASAWHTAKLFAFRCEFVAEMAAQFLSCRAKKNN